MVRKNKTIQNKLGKDQFEVTIPDEAISYIMNRYLQGKNNDGAAPIVVGIPTHVVEDVLQLFVDWAAQHGYVKDSMLIIGGQKVN